MTNDFARLFDRFNELSVGFGPVFKDFNHSSSGYPPHNIITVSDNEFDLELAIAGFKKNEVTIQETDGVLTITADKETNSEANYQYHGIARRSFSKKFHIAEHYEIKEAGLEDGILTIKFVKNMPDLQIKRIAIK